MPRTTGAGEPFSGCAQCAEDNERSANKVSAQTNGIGRTERMATSFRCNEGVLSSCLDPVCITCNKILPSCRAKGSAFPGDCLFAWKPGTDCGACEAVGKGSRCLPVCRGWQRALGLGFVPAAGELFHGEPKGSRDKRRETLTRSQPHRPVRGTHCNSLETLVMYLVTKGECNCRCPEKALFLNGSAKTILRGSIQ